MEIRTGILASVGVCLAFALLPTAAQSQERSAAISRNMPRLRSGNGRLTALIDEGMKGSPTFRNLVAALEATDGVVFVEEGRCPRRLPACLPWRITLAGAYRYLFVVIDTRRSDDVVASIGHELQHALEVLTDRSLRSPGAIFSFYVRGRSPEDRRARETAAAEAAGDAVFRELRHYRSRAQP